MRVSTTSSLSLVGITISAGLWALLSATPTHASEATTSEALQVPPTTKKYLVMWGFVLSVFASLLVRSVLRNQARGHGAAGLAVWPNLNVLLNRLGVFIGWVYGGICFAFHLLVNGIVWVYHFGGNVLNGLANRMVGYQMVAGDRDIAVTQTVKTFTVLFSGTMAIVLLWVTGKPSFVVYAACLEAYFGHFCMDKFRAFLQARNAVANPYVEFMLVWIHWFWGWFPHFQGPVVMVVALLLYHFLLTTFGFVHGCFPLFFGLLPAVVSAMLYV